MASKVAGIKEVEENAEGPRAAGEKTKSEESTEILSKKDISRKY